MKLMADTIGGEMVVDISQENHHENLYLMA